MQLSYIGSLITVRFVCLLAFKHKKMAKLVKALL